MEVSRIEQAFGWKYIQSEPSHLADKYSKLTITSFSLQRLKRNSETVLINFAARVFSIPIRLVKNTNVDSSSHTIEQRD